MKARRYAGLAAALAVAVAGLGLAGAERAHGAEIGFQGPVVAHRGLASASATENGKYAVRDALRAGADGVEVDVRATKDGKLVVMHDVTLDRTTDCVGEVARLTYAQVRACSLRSGERVPNVYDIAATFSKYDSKHDQLWLHVKFDPTSKLRAELFKAVDKHGLRAKVVVLADEGEMLDSFRKWSKIHRALIFNQADVNQGLAESWGAGYDYAVPYQTPVNPALIEVARSTGSLVWAVEDNPVTVDQAEFFGLDGFLANRI